MYDHNQTLVPDAFIALFVRRGRLTAERAEVERRHELAEDLALQIAAMPAVAGATDPAAQAAGLDLCRAGLRAEPVQVTEAEAEWVVRRVTELHGWEWPGP